MAAHPQPTPLSLQHGCLQREVGDIAKEWFGRQEGILRFEGALGEIVRAVERFDLVREASGVGLQFPGNHLQLNENGESNCRVFEMSPWTTLEANPRAVTG